MHRLLSEEFKDLTILSESTGLIYYRLCFKSYVSKRTCRLQNLKKMRTRTEEKVNNRNHSIQDGGRNHQVHVQDH